MESQNIVYIGRKPLMAYTMAVMTSLRSEGDEVVLKARGRAISTAVDVAEVVRNQFIEGLQVKEISIGTELLEGMDGSTRNALYLSILIKSNLQMPEYVKRVHGNDKEWHWNPKCPDYPYRGKETVLILNETPKGVICSKCSEQVEESDD